MTTVPKLAVVRPAAVAAPVGVPEGLWTRLWRWFDRGLVLLALGALIADRVALLRDYLFKYTDHDQVLLWYGVREVLHGRFHEPCFYGQSYNSMLESFLAAPLVGWVHVRPEMALPIVGVILGVLPFLLLAAVAFRWRLFLAAAAALLIPLVLPFTYSIIASMPRGFTDGLALAAVAMVLLLPHYPVLRVGPLAVRPKRVAAWWRRAGKWCVDFVRPRQTLAFFVAGVASGFGVVLNPNSGPLLLAVYIYAVLRFHQNWRFWLWTAAGLAPGAAWYYHIYQFYYVLHTDYRWHLRDARFPWSSELLTETLPKAPEFFMHYLPTPNVCVVLLVIAGGLVGVLGLLRQYRAAVAALVTTGFIFFTLGYDRVDQGTTNLYYPLSRMYLALPVIAAFLVFFVDRGLVKFFPLRWLLIVVLLPLLSWPFKFTFRRVVGLVDRTLAGGIVLRRLLILGLIPLACWACRIKYAAKEQVYADSLKNTSFMIVRPVKTIYDAAATLRPMLAAEHVDFVLFYDDVFLGYSLPLILDCETLTTSYERRTWLLHDESAPRHERILIYATGGDPEDIEASVKEIDPAAKTLSRGPLIMSVAMKQRSVIQIARRLHMHVREFIVPEK